MSQSTNRIFDEMAKLFGNAAATAQTLRQEIDSIVRAQAERILNELDLVQREEFDAVRDMAARAREENERLKTRITALEAASGKTASSAGKRSRTATARKSASGKPAATKQRIKKGADSA